MYDTFLVEIEIHFGCPISIIVMGRVRKHIVDHMGITHVI